MKKQAKKVLVPIADGSEEIEVVCIIDVLRRASAEVTVASIAPEGRLDIIASRGVKLIADCSIENCQHENFDLIVLPGGLQGAERMRDHSLLIKLLQKQGDENKLLGAICASPALVFNTHQLLGKQQATCHPAFIDQLPDNMADANARVVVDNNIITSQAPGTALEFAVILVELLYGADKAREVAGPLVLHA